MHKHIIGGVALGVSFVMAAVCAADPAAGPATHTAPTTAAPWLGLASNGGDAVVTGLPAVSTDGKHVAIAITDRVGQMSRPTLRLRLIARTDDVEREIKIIDPDDAKLAPAAPLATANNALAAAHAKSAWLPLTKTPAPDTGPQLLGDGPKTTVIAGPDSAQLSYLNGHITVKVGTAKVVDKAVAAWKAKPNRDAPVPCTNGSYASAAYFDVAHKIILVDISYTGSDSCQEPSPTHHVVAW